MAKKYISENGQGLEVWDKPSNATLFAHWTARSYQVTLNQNGATTEGQKSVTATYDSNIPTVTNLPSKTGHDFYGFYDLDNKQYIDADGLGIIWDKDSAYTLTAKFYAHLYTITFDSNGGTGGVIQLPKRYGEVYGTLPSAGTKSGYTFVAWTNGTDVLQPTSIVDTTRHSWTARWDYLTNGYIIGDNLYYNGTWYAIPPNCTIRWDVIYVNRTWDGGGGTPYYRSDGWVCSYYDRDEDFRMQADLYNVVTKQQLTFKWDEGS